MSQENHSAEQQSRRALLKMAAYVPPAILGVMTAGIEVAEAATISCPGTKGKTQTFTVSAMAAACCPCVPGSTTYNTSACKCVQGVCTSCASAIFYNKGDCRKVPAQCNCACRKNRQTGQKTC